MNLTPLLVVLTAVPCLFVTAQTPPKFKAIWEPINYKQDLNLTGVYFIEERTGRVTGAAGTILHTDDAGDSYRIVPVDYTAKGMIAAPAMSVQ